MSHARQTIIGLIRKRRGLGICFFYPSHVSVRSRVCGITTVVSLRSVGRLVWCVRREDYTVKKSVGIGLLSMVSHIFLSG